MRCQLVCNRVRNIYGALEFLGLGPYVQALQDWLIVANIERGALFRQMFRGDKVGTQRLTAQSVANIVKDYAYKIGLDRALFAGHSLRRGFLTSATKKRVSIFKMADQSRHKSLDVLRQNVKAENIFADNADANLLKSD